jgi:hypothetical protein
MDYRSINAELKRHCEESNKQAEMKKKSPITKVVAAVKNVTVSDIANAAIGLLLK